MLNNRSLSILAVLTVFLLYYSCGNRTAYSQEGFTNASFQGNYSIVFTIGANETVSIGTFVAEGNGSIKGSGIFNIQLTRKKRRIIKFTFDSTYNLNANGIGESTATVTLLNDDGSVMDVFESGLDFVITQAEEQEDGNKLVLESTCIAREPAPLPGGGLLIGTTRKLPD